MPYLGAYSKTYDPDLRVEADILSGSLVFVSCQTCSRAAAQSLFDYLEGGESIDEHLPLHHISRFRALGKA